MPTYDYVCDKCRKTFEIWQRISEEPLTVCPDKKCRGTIMRTIGGGAGFLLKGTGFYATDYRSGDYKKKALGEKAAPASSAGAGSGTDSAAKPKSGGETKV